MKMTKYELKSESINCAIRILDSSSSLLTDIYI